MRFAKCLRPCPRATRFSCAGAYAEYAVADWGRATPIPAGMGFEQAATLPIDRSFPLPEAAAALAHIRANAHSGKIALTVQ